MSTNTVNADKAAATTGTPVATQTELEARVTTRRNELIAKLAQMKTEGGIEAAQARDRLKAKLSQLGHITKENVVDGWSSLGETVKGKFERWLAESAQS